MFKFIYPPYMNKFLCKNLAMKRNNYSESRLFVFATRTIFLCLLVISSSQITCTIVFMLLCRRSSKEIVLSLNLSEDPCGGQGLPAYIASAIFLVTIFGFGCVGRRSTSIILFLLAVCDIGLSVFIAVTGSERNLNVKTDKIAQELQTSTVSCFPYMMTNLTNNTSQSKCLDFFSFLFHLCPDIHYQTISRYDNFTHLSNCTNLIDQTLTNIKFEYYPVSLSFQFSSSLFYTILSILLFWVQYKDKKLPGYQRREHILNVPEFKECPTNDESVVYEDLGPKLTIKLCILNILWCRCHVLLKHRYCCGVSRRKKNDVYEFTVLPVKHVQDEKQEDHMASVTQLV